MNISKLFIITLLCLSVQYSTARIVFGIRDASNTLIRFDHTAPALILSSVAIAGLSSGENVVGIDIRPQNGKVYVVTTQSRVYVLNTITGATSEAQTLNSCTTPSGANYAIDFNPVVDRLRIISSTGNNYVVNVDTGACFINTTISGTPTPTIAQVAYTNSFRGASSTTLFAIDVTASALGSIPTPNNGVYVQIGALGVTSTNQIGFDIVESNAWASLTNPTTGASTLYTINTATGAATAVGQIGGTALRAIAISFTDYDRTFFGLNDAGNLFRFESEDASSWVASAITGLTNEFFLGVDFRLLNGLLYGVTNASRVYAINPFTSAVTAIGNPLNCTFFGQYFGVDWNPTADLLRVITDSGANYRINVNTSACFVDSPITSTTAYGNTLISSVAYTNNVAPSTSTVLYAIDYSGDSLGTITTPNSGVFVWVANLSQVTGPATGFDIFGQPNSAVAALQVEGIPYFVALDLSSAAVSFIASPGTVNVRSLSASYARLPYALSGFYPEVLILTSAGNIVRLNSNNTVNIISSTAVTGLTSGTTLLGMDLRPATNEIVGVASDGKIYIIYAPTAVAYYVSTLNCSLSSSSTYSFDFNPAADRLRIVSRTGENYRVEVSTGYCTIDGALAYTGGGVPDAVGVAYTNSFSGATSTAEYILVSGSNANLAQVTAPNVGTTSIVGPTGVSISSQSPLDILTNGQQQQTFALINGVLYDINLGSGAARPYGSVGFTNHIGLTVLPLGYTPPSPPSGTTSTSSTGITANATSSSTSTSTSTSTTGTTGNSASSVAVSLVLLVASLVLFM